MKEYDFEGRTREEALLKASEFLKMNISDMNYKVIELESSMFGLVKKVKVVVQVDDEHVLQALEEESREDEQPETPVMEPVENNVPGDVLLGERVNDVLGRIIELMGISAVRTIEETDQEVVVDIKSQEPDVLTGKDGRVLSSLQFIVNRIVNRRSDVRKHVLLDVDGFKERREAQLQEEARQMAMKAVESNRIFKMGPLNAKDRRIIHLALKDNADVSTKSEGNGAQRRLLIIPRGLQGRGGRGKNRGRKRERPRRQNGQATEPKNPASE